MKGPLMFHEANIVVPNIVDFDVVVDNVVDVFLIVVADHIVLSCDH